MTNVELHPRNEAGMEIFNRAYKPDYLKCRITDLEELITAIYNLDVLARNISREGLELVPMLRPQVDAVNANFKMIIENSGLSDDY